MFHSVFENYANQVAATFSPEEFQAVNLAKYRLEETIIGFPENDFLTKSQTYKDFIEALQQLVKLRAFYLSQHPALPAYIEHMGLDTEYEYDPSEGVFTDPVQQQGWIDFKAGFEAK